MTTISMEAAWYDALVDAALAGDTDQVRTIDNRIRTQAGIVRFRVWVRWLEVGGSPAPRAHPQNWPVEQTAEIVMDRAVSRDDVIGFLKNKSLDAVEVHVTYDPNGKVGWYELDAFPF